MKISYDPEIDALYVRLRGGNRECRSVGLSDEVALNIGAALMLALQQADVEGIYFGIVADFHGSSHLKIERGNGNENYFVGFRLDDRRNLLYRVMFSLPLGIERKVVAAHFPSMLGGFARALPNGLFHFGDARAAFHRLFLGMVCESNRFHFPASSTILISSAVRP